MLTFLKLSSINLPTFSYIHCTFYARPNSFATRQNGAGTFKWSIAFKFPFKIRLLFQIKQLTYLHFRWCVRGQVFHSFPHSSSFNTLSTNTRLIKFYYYINTSEIPGELSRVNMISSHVKICYFTPENNMFSHFLRLPLL